MHALDLPSLLHLRSLWWPRLLAVLAAAMLLWGLARLLLLLIGGPNLPAPSLPPGLPLPTAATGNAPTVRLSQWHLFGDAAGAPDLARLVQQAPETALQLVLRGTLNLQASDGGIAIIADAQGHEEAYRVGDMLPGDARLTAIYAGRVLLSRNGVDEGLSLLPPGSAGTAAPGQRVPGSGSVPRPQPTPGSIAQPVPAFVQPTLNFGAPSMESLRAATGTDIAELAKQVNVVPVMENGRLAGVRLSVGRDSDILARSGLRSTDIITAVNGLALDNAQNQAELLRSLQTARQLNVTIRRDGKTQTLTVGL